MTVPENHNLFLTEGDGVMVYLSHETTKKCRWIARPFLGPCKLLEKHPNGITVQPVGQPKGPSI